MLKVGLTGGIASGKSHVLRRLAGAGFQTLDLDAVARDVMAPGGTAYGDVAVAFGTRILAEDGSIDRKALGEYVFADAAARRRLEALVHPRIREAEVLYLSSGAPDSVAVVDAALLVESGQHLRFARLMVVVCEPGEQLRRLVARDGISEAAARARLDAQMAPLEKKRFGHFVIDNSRAPAETDAQVDAVIATLRSLAADRAPQPRVPVARAANAVAAGPPRGPRGLRPWGVLEEIAASGALDMARIAALLDPPHDGPWYQAAAARTSGEAPETLAVPVAVWSAGQRPADAPFAIAAAASMARLTHRDPAAVSGAVLAALAALHCLATGQASSLRSGLPEWIAAAGAWAGAAPPPSTVATVLAAAAHAGDGEAASREAAAAGGVPDLARALAGGTAKAPVEREQLGIVGRVLGETGA
jgi:dephospho-CoA kinase